MSGGDDLADVLAALAGGASLTKDQLREATHLMAPDIDRAVTNLKGRSLVRHMGRGYWSATQRECAGACARRGRDLRGQTVEFDPETLRWFCGDCWAEQVAQVRGIVDG